MASIWKRVKIVAAELVNPRLENTPAWYNWAKNQATHFLLGAITAWALTTVVFFLHGEYPDKMALFVTIAGAYLAKELMFDKWQGWDTINDNLFFSVLGAGGAIMSFSEQTIGDWTPRANEHWITAALVVFFSYLVAGVLWQVDDDV